MNELRKDLIMEEEGFFLFVMHGWITMEFFWGGGVGLSEM